MVVKKPRVFNLDIRCVVEKRVKSIGRSGLRTFAHTYQDFLNVIKEKRNPALKIGVNSDFIDYLDKEDILLFIPSKIGGDIFNHRRVQNISEYFLGNGFVMFEGEFYVCTLTKGTYESTADGSHTLWSLELTKKVHIPNTGRQGKRIKEEYKTKKGTFIWDETALDWILQK